MANIVQILLPFLFYIVSPCYGQSAGYQCPQNGYSWRADPKNCSVAHLCVFGTLIQSLTCPKDLVIGVDNYSCVQKGSYFDNCGQRVELFIVNDTRCATNRDGNNPDPENCARFINCFNGTSLGFQTCPRGLFFSTTNFTCQYPENVECGSRTIAPEYKQLAVISKRCRHAGLHLISHESDCHRYYECQGGTNSPKACSQGLVFSQKKQTCVEHWKANDAKC